ncbi:unnamed protein product, partial [Mesorhabditis spiculigera]
MKFAIVTGASSGIGRATAVELAKKGYAIAITARSQDELEKTKKACTDAGCPSDKVIVIQGDLTEKATAEKVVEETVGKLGGIDVLVNNAGFAIAGMLSGMPVEEFDRQMNLNVRSLHQLTQLALPHLLKSHGNIVNISSVASEMTQPAAGFYCVSKAALDMYTKCLALELAPKGVRVNSINPGLIDTAFGVNAGMCTKENRDERMAPYIAAYPIGRAGLPEEIAHAVVFLASTESSFTTGAILHVDGARRLGTRIGS